MRVFTHYYQFGIWDAEAPDSYPIPNDEEKFVLGKKGLVILINKEKKIDLSVSNKGNKALPYKMLETEITFGSKGVEYGNVAAATVGSYPLASGTYKIRLYSDKIDLNKSNQFHFIIQGIN